MRSKRIVHQSRRQSQGRLVEHHQSRLGNGALAQSLAFAVRHPKAPKLASFAAREARKAIVDRFDIAPDRRNPMRQ